MASDEQRQAIETAKAAILATGNTLDEFLQTIKTKKNYDFRQTHHYKALSALYPRDKFAGILDLALTEEVPEEPTDPADPTDPPPTGTPAFPNAFFAGDFEDGTFRAYERLHDLTTRSTIVTSPTPNPLGFSKVAAIRVREIGETWVGGGDTSVAGDASYFGRNPPKPYELEGAVAVYRFAILLPSGNDARYPGRYRYPSAMQSGGKGRGFSVFWQLHEFQNGKWSNTIMETPSGLTVRSDGGTTAQHGPESFDFHEKVVGDGAGNAHLPFDRWHEFIVERKSTYKSGNGGYMRVTLNGRQIFPTSDMPASWRTMWYRADGQTKGYQYLQAGHYRASPRYWVNLLSDYDDTTYSTPVVIGPTRASVGA
jgi:hypothetical protein